MVRPLASERVPVGLSADVRERYVGTYVFAETGTEFEVGLEERGLALTLQDGNAVLWPLSDSMFFDVEDGREVSFSGEGDAVELMLGGLRATRAQR